MLFIEPAIRDDIISLQFTIDEIVKFDDNGPETLAVLEELRRQYQNKILELDRIQNRIRIYDPEWLSLEEQEKEFYR